MLQTSKLKKINKIPFFVGDIHGCYEEFLSLLEKAQYSPQKHRLILVGDVINRGPFSFEMLKWIKSNKVEVVLGNHEFVFLKEVKKGVLRDSFKTLKEQMAGDFSSWVKWIQTWPLYIEEEDFIVIHAGLVPGEHPSASNPNYLLHIRNWDAVKGIPVVRAKDKKQIEIQDKSFLPWYEFYKGKKTVIYGHWAMQGLMLRENTIGLDTGCVYGEHLSGIFLPERKIVQVKAKQAYYKK